MKKKVLTLIALLIICLTVVSAMASEASDANLAGKNYVVFNIDKISTAALEKFEKDPAVLNYCLIDDKLIAVCEKDKWPVTPQSAKRLRTLAAKKDLSEPFIATRRGSRSPLDEYRDQINVLYASGPYTIFQAPMFVVNEILKKENNHFRVQKFDQNLVLRISSKYFEASFVAPADVPSAEVNVDRLKGYARALVDFKTRYSYGKGYENAARFAVEEFKKLGYEAKLSEYKDGGRTQYNVVAQKSFAGVSNFYIVCGHLDSTSNNAMTDAPGADDNASGSAGVLEIANIVAKTPDANKFRFVLFAGEEVGLRGSNAYVRQLTADGELSRVLGVVNFDMIGFDKTAPLSSLFETHEFSKPFITNFINEAAKKGILKVTVSYNAWGSDHIAFLKAKVPCFLFIEDEFEENTTYHKTTDKIEFVNFSLSAEIVRVTAQTLLNLVATK
ncbi:MAG TPA: M28 family peptidase [Candidatus Wallbacteria bacterium]|nr:M28 family peptidase [Candidatus Wallbacteria bacterium]